MVTEDMATSSSSLVSPTVELLAPSVKALETARRFRSNRIAITGKVTRLGDEDEMVSCDEEPAALIRAFGAKGRGDEGSGNSSFGCKSNPEGN